VVLVPRDMPTMPQSVLVASDGSREAAVAVQAALPFLKQANEVSVLSIGKPIVNTPSAEHCATQLRRHNINADAREIEAAKGKRDFDQFLDCVNNSQPNLIVMGGYSHNRWREMVLGGLTRALTEQSPCPVLLAH